jgi:antitoxin HigA-1
MKIPKYRSPTHPGEMLLKEFLEPMEITQQALARSINVPYQRVNELINGKRGITPSTALRLAKFLGNSPDFWLNLQNAWKIDRAQRTEAEQLEKIKPLATPTKNLNKAVHNHNHV